MLSNRVWDLEEGTEIRSYDITEGFGVARFYNNEKCVLLAGDNSTFAAMDLHTEEIIFQDDEIWGVSGTCMDLIADGKKVVHATAEKISLFDVDGSDIVSIYSVFRNISPFVKLLWRSFYFDCFVF